MTRHEIISGSIDVPNHRSPYVFAHLSRMARFYDGWLRNSPNSLYRGRTHPIASIQAYIKPYRQGLQDILIVSTIKTSYLADGGVTQLGVTPSSFAWHSYQE